MEPHRRWMPRRQLLAAGAAAGGLLGSQALASHPVIARALAALPACGSLRDIEHVVLLIQENSSSDHYFGTYRGVRRFAEPTAPRLRNGSGLNVFAQPGFSAAGYDGYLRPFHIGSCNNGECTSDISRSWGPQHSYAMSGTPDPDARAGGPILSTSSTSSTRVDRYGKLTWATMPEHLEPHRITWKVRGSTDGNYGDNVLPHYKNLLQNPPLPAKALLPSFPGTFPLDTLLGTRPAVSWIVAPLLASEHPPAPVEFGETTSAAVVRALTANPVASARTALFITHDENGGFFDHVPPPPTSPPGTAGELLSLSPSPADAGGFRGPSGLGFRVQRLVVSPFTRGGFVCSDTFDHTSLLRFLETRVGVEVPNLTSWRRSVTGDLTTGFNFAAPDRGVPQLPRPTLLDIRVLLSTCLTAAPPSLVTELSTTLSGLESTVLAPYPLAPPQSQPAQAPGRAAPPSEPVPCPR
ncbi:MAG: alkaline phosphatase family protein [Solirubrobacteraceae bacterium]